MTTPGLGPLLAEAQALKEALHDAFGRGVRLVAAVKRQRGTRPTGTYPPNGYGLYDMIGNAWEWVSDWYSADYYSSGDVRDPRGPAMGNMRIVRGGSWVNDDVAMLTCAYRHKVPPDTYAHSVGFRIVFEAQAS